MSELKYFTPSVDMAAKILTLLSRYKTKKSSLTEICTALDVNKSTCLRVLKTLEYHNLVFHDVNSKKYSLGIGAIVIGSRAQENLEYFQYIKPYLKAVTEETNLVSVFVERIALNRLMFVAKEQPNKETSLNVSIGNKFPLTGVGYGKWFITYMDEDERMNLFNSISENELKENVFDSNEVEDLKQNRVTCVVKDNLYAISAPILGRNNSILGVMAVIGILAGEDDAMKINAMEVVRKNAFQCSENFREFDFTDFGNIYVKMSSTYSKGDKFGI